MIRNNKSVCEGSQKKIKTILPRDDDNINNSQLYLNTIQQTIQHINALNDLDCCEHVDRSVIDFNKPYICNETNNKCNVYCCLKCGIFLSGANNGPISLHALEQSHYKSINLTNGSILDLSCNQTIKDNQLSDIVQNLKPVYDCYILNNLKFLTYQLQPHKDNDVKSSNQIEEQTYCKYCDKDITFYKTTFKRSFINAKLTISDDIVYGMDCFNKSFIVSNRVLLSSSYNERLLALCLYCILTITPLVHKVAVSKFSNEMKDFSTALLYYIKQNLLTNPFKGVIKISNLYNKIIASSLVKHTSFNSILNLLFQELTSHDELRSCVQSNVLLFQNSYWITIDQIEDSNDDLNSTKVYSLNKIMNDKLSKDTSVKIKRWMIVAFSNELVDSSLLKNLSYNINYNPDELKLGSQTYKLITNIVVVPDLNWKATNKVKHTYNVYRRIENKWFYELDCKLEKCPDMRVSANLPVLQVWKLV